MSAEPAGGGSSLVRRLLLSYALLVLLIVTTGGAGVWALTTSLAATDRVLAEVVPARQANAAALLHLTEVQSGVRGYLLTGRPTFLAGARRGAEEFAVLAPSLVRLARDAGAAGPAVDQVRQGRAYLRDYYDPAERARQVSGGLDELRRTRDAEAARRAFEAFRSFSTTVDAELTAESRRLQDRSLQARQVALAVLLVVLVVSVVFGSLAAFRTSRGVVRPLGVLRRTVELMTAGERDRRVDATVGLVEVRAVARAVNAMADEGERLRVAEQDQVRMRRTAHDVGLVVRESIDLDEVMTVAVGQVGSSFGADRVLLRRLSRSGLGPVEAQWHELDLEPLDHAALDAVATAGDAAQAARLWRDGSVAPAPDVAAALGHGSGVVVAFGAGPRPLGTLTLLQEHGARGWSSAELAAIEAVAADLGRALHHGGLYARERELVEQLRELDRTKSDFLSTVSHELRTPLTSITGYIELLREGDAALDPAQLRSLEVIERNGRRLSALIEDLLVLARIESGAVRAQRVAVEVAVLVRTACADVSAAAEAAGLELHVADGDASVQVVGDPDQLDRVLLNLLSNAVKFTPAGGRVDVGWWIEGPDVVLSVRDTGIGIPEHDLASLSSRFFRASNAMAAAIPGTGLGLSIVRGILDAHGGRLHLEGAGPGTRAVVRLPRPAVVAPEQAGTPVAPGTVVTSTDQAQGAAG